MSPSQTLLKTQKNKIYDILIRADLEPADFSWSEEPSIKTKGRDLIVSRLNYRDGHFYFHYDLYQNEDPWCEFSPGEEKAVKNVYTGSWEEQIKYTVLWAQLLKREIDAPDFWHEIEKYKATFSLAPPDQLLNEPIPAHEVEKIVEALNLLANKMKEQFELNEDQNNFVRSKLNYLAEAAKRQGRLDWVHTCIGVLITIATALALNLEKANMLWQLVKSLLGQFIHMIAP